MFGQLAYTVGRRWWRAHSQEFWTVWPGCADPLPAGQYGKLTLLQDHECVEVPFVIPPPAPPFFPPRLVARWAARARRMARTPAGA